MKQLAWAVGAILALAAHAAFAQTGTGTGGQPNIGVQRGDSGRLGTSHPNAAAGQVRLRPPQGQIDVQSRRSAGPQLAAPRAAVPVPSFAPVPSDAVDPSLAEETPALPGQAAPGGTRGALPPIGRQRPVPDRDPPPASADRLVPLSGDLEFGIQQRVAGFGHREFYEQQMQLNREAAREPGGGSAAESPDDRQRVVRVAGRWWYQRSSGEWLVYDERTARWRPFHPGEFAGRP